MTIKPILPRLLLLLSAPLAHMAHAAESYDGCTGHYIDALPANISTQGTWCLRKDLNTAITSGAAILVAANNVTIDCNGFKIGGLAAGNESSAAGIAADRLDTTVRHCTIRGFSAGITLDGGGHLVEDNRLDGNLVTGIYVGGGDSQVLRNIVLETGGSGVGFPPNPYSYGILADGDVIDNIVSGVFPGSTNGNPTGIAIVGNGHEVRDNRVRDLRPGTGTAFGIDVPGNDNTLRGNALVAGQGTVGGFGIRHEGSITDFCGGNTIASFVTYTKNCQDIGGNAYH